MIIKKPTSDVALRKMWNFLRIMEDRLGNCYNRSHDFLTVVYMSTYVLSPSVTFQGSNLLDKIRELINSSPQRVVWLLRTTSPYSFPQNPRSKALSIRNLQKQAIDSLRDICYIVMYNKNEFLNHAKFLVYYHICFSEGILYHGKYYGSTNLTNAGLSDRSGRFPGNYEEFVVMGPKPRFLRFTNFDRFYLNEVYDLLLHKVRLYTDRDYLRRFFSEHLRHFDRLLQHAQRILSGTTLGEVYDAYISMQMLYNQTFSILDQLPGKKLTVKLIESIEIEIGPPEYTLELEMKAINDLTFTEKILSEMGLDKKELKELLNESVKNAKRMREKLIEYKNIIESVVNYFDEKEEKFAGYIENNAWLHINYVKKVKIMAEIGGM